MRMDQERNPGAIDYFHRRIQDFDDIYRDDKKGLLSFLNKTVRASVRIRFELAFNILGDLSGKSVLDIGCGSGRYMFKALEKNAGYAVNHRFLRPSCSIGNDRSPAGHGFERNDPKILLAREDERTAFRQMTLQFPVRQPSQEFNVRTGQFR